MAATQHPGGTPPPNERGVLLGLTLIAVLAALLVGVDRVGLQADQHGPGVVLLGLYVMAWGGMFLLSYRYSHKTFFLRALKLTCEEFSRPNHPKMALFHGALGFGLGVLAVVTGLRWI